MGWGGQWKPYVPVARRRVNASREMSALRKRGKAIQPVEIEGRKIAASFWGKGWCDHLESFSDFSNRLPRGRTYVRNGSVCHLNVRPGRIEAVVSGSELYNVNVRIKKLEPSTWKSVKKKCSGRIGSMLELLQGKLSDQVMSVVTDRKQGLFPRRREIEYECDCPDWAVMCKHVAAVFYGVGSRLDDRPDLLFVLRDVDPQELISAELAVPATASGADALAADQLGDIFGIELEGVSDEQSTPAKKPRKRGRPARRVAPKKTTDKKTRARATSGRRAPAGKVAAPRVKPTGKSIARLRKRLKLSAAEFAKRLGVSATSIYRWEAANGQLNLQARPLAALAELRQQARQK